MKDHLNCVADCKHGETFITNCPRCRLAVCQAERDDAVDLLKACGGHFDILHGIAGNLKKSAELMMEDVRATVRRVGGDG